MSTLTPGCDPSCLSCSGSHAGSCTSCRDDRRLEGHGHCVPLSSTCTLRQYADQDGECHPCHKYCHRCTGPGKSQCLSCNQRHLLLSEFGARILCRELQTSASGLFGFSLILFVCSYRWHLCGGMPRGPLRRRIRAGMRAVSPFLSVVRRGEELRVPRLQSPLVSRGQRVCGDLPAQVV